MPRGIPNSKTEAAEQQVGQTQVLDVPLTGSVLDIERTDQIVQAVDGPSFDDYAKELAFNEEYLDVVVHESTDKNAEQMVDVYVNGTPQRFLRGQVQKVKRKYVEVLARAKNQSIQTVVQTTTDDVVNRIIKNSALRYPFAVQHDPNPRGQAWLRKVLAEAA